MNRLIIIPKPDPDGSPQILTIKKKSGEVKEFRGGRVLFPCLTTIYDCEVQQVPRTGGKWIKTRPHAL